MPAALPSYYELVAEALLASPELVAVARDNVRRWLAQGHGAPQRLLAWDRLLAGAQTDDAGRAALQLALRSDEPAAARLREFAPLAGILSREQRRRARELCGYRQ